MTPEFQIYWDGNGDIFVARGSVYQLSTNVRKTFAEVGYGVTGFEAPVLFSGWQAADSAGVIIGAGGSGRNLLVNPTGGGFYEWKNIPRVILPSAADTWTTGQFVIAKTGASTATLSDGTNIIAEMTSGSAPVGTYTATTYGEDTYNTGDPFTIDIEAEDGAPGDIPPGIITPSAGTFPTSGGFSGVDEWTWALASDALATIETAWDGSAELRYDGDVIATRDAGGNPRSPGGDYTATAQGETDFNSGDPWTAVIESPAISPQAGSVYIHLIKSSGTLSEVRGPYLGVLPSNSGDNSYIPIGRSDGLGTVFQYHTGMIIIP